LRVTTGRCLLPEAIRLSPDERFGNDRPASAHRFGTAPLAEVADELLHGLVGLGMGAQLREELGRHGHYISTRLERFVDVDHLADAADDDLARAVPLLERLAHLPNDRGGVIAG